MKTYHAAATGCAIGAGVNILIYSANMKEAFLLGSMLGALMALLIMQIGRASETHYPG